MGVRDDFLREALVLVFTLGLAAQVGGYGLGNAASGGPLGLLAELLVTLGAPGRTPPAHASSGDLLGDHPISGR